MDIVHKHVVFYRNVYKYSKCFFDFLHMRWISYLHQVTTETLMKEYLSKKNDIEYFLFILSQSINNLFTVTLYSLHGHVKPYNPTNRKLKSYIFLSMDG